MKIPPFRLIAAEDSWKSCLKDLKKQPRLAIDLESNSLFSYREEVCLIQVSTADQDYILDPISGIDLFEFGLIIQDPAVEKVFHAAEYDSILIKSQYGWKLENLFDTMWAARILGYERYGLANLLEETYGVKLNKKYQKANWCKRPLSRAQLNYAQMDTHFLLRLRDDLAEKLEAEGRIEEAKEIFAEQTNVRPPNREFNPHGFWNISGVKELPPKNQAVVRALYLYRDDQAKRQNRPHFKIFGEQTIMELAVKLPKRQNELNGIYGMSSRQISRYGRHMLKIIQRAQNDPAPKRPRKKSRRPSDKVSSRFDRLHLWRKERARSRGVESDVIVSREALWELARENPTCPADLSNISLLGPWRQETYGEEILQVLTNS